MQTAIYLTHVFKGIFSQMPSEQRKFTSDKDRVSDFFARQKDDFPELLGNVPVYETLRGKRMSYVNDALAPLHAMGVVWHCGGFSYEFNIGRERRENALAYFPSYVQQPLRGLAEKFYRELMW